MKTEEPKTKLDDVDDVVGIASEMMQEEQGALTAPELKEVGRELDIPPEYIDRARTELSERRAEETRHAEEQKAERARWLRYGGIGLAALLAIFGLWGVSSVSSLRDLHAEVETRRAQLDNVRARKAAVIEGLAGRPDSVDKDAEIIGAENRIRVEAQRYAEVVVRYNAARASFPASWFASWFGLPDELPLSG